MMLLKAFHDDTHGGAAIEYALVASMIAVVIAGALGGMYGKLNTSYGNIRDAIPS